MRRLLTITALSLAVPAAGALGAEKRAAAGPAPAKAPIVTSVNGLSGSVTLAAGANVAIAPSGNTLTISAAAGRTLFLGVDRGGYGTISASTGATCTHSCLVDVPTPVSVTVAATPLPGTFFRGWSGDCSGLGACSVTMDKSHAVTANFALITTPFGVELDGPGVVYSAPLGIYCGVMCVAEFEPGTGIHLTAAAPDGGARFMGWLLGCADDPHSPNCQVIAGDQTSVKAQFGWILDVAIQGQGSVASDPEGIACPAGCTAAFPEGPPVTLTATPSPGWKFTGWDGGPCAVTGLNPCSVSTSRAWGVTALFEPI